jgi:hypothetical protein
MPHPQDKAIARIATLAAGGPVDPSWRVTLHFHPDRLVAGVPILQLMTRDGVYRSQFETGSSNGGLTAHPGGDRWRWESRIFAATYDNGPTADRPKYGSLNFRRRLVGGSPRFGSAYLRLAAHTMTRTTFCYPDSVFEPEHFGVASRLSSWSNWPRRTTRIRSMTTSKPTCTAWSTSAGTPKPWSWTPATATPR